MNWDSIKITIREVLIKKINAGSDNVYFTHQMSLKQRRQGDIQYVSSLKIDPEIYCTYIEKYQNFW